MLAGIKHLRADVFRAAAERLVQIIQTLSLLAKTEVCQLDVPSEVNKDVFWLQISIRNVVIVQVLNRQDDLSYYHFCILFIKSLLLAEMIEQLASRAELKDEMQVLLSPECLDELNDERISQLMQDLPLQVCLLKLALVEQLLDADDFHRSQHAVAVLARQDDTREAAFSHLGQ